MPRRPASPPLPARPDAPLPGHDHPHDPDTCPICGPIIHHPAYRRGIARAEADRKANT